MEREGAEVPALGPKLEARASAYGPEDPALPGVPDGTPGSDLKQTSAWERTYKHARHRHTRAGGYPEKGEKSQFIIPNHRNHSSKGAIPSPSMGEGQGEGERGQGAGRS